MLLFAPLSLSLFRINYASSIVASGELKSGVMKCLYYILPNSNMGCNYKRFLTCILYILRVRLLLLMLLLLMLLLLLLVVLMLLLLMQSAATSVVYVADVVAAACVVVVDATFSVVAFAIACVIFFGVDALDVAC